jgi:membrane protease YdiL (CAAX protease family)
LPEQDPKVPVEVRAGPPSGDRVAAALRGFGPVGILAMLIILLAGNHPFVPLSAILVLVWARWSRTPWREIGYGRPRSWAVSLGVGIAFGIAFGIPAALYTMIVGAGFGEQTVFRGYLFERLGKLFGPGRGAKASIVLLTAVLFGLAHYSRQGRAGVEQGTIVGLVFGTIFAATGRIWMLMFAHAAFDLTALAIIYWNLESEVAHVFFE